MAAKLEVFTLEDIKAFTDNFNKKNMVGDVQFGKVYRGKIEGGMIGSAEARDVTVKIWNKSSDYIAFTYDEYMMLKAKVEFLENPTMKGHPNLAKLIGYCCEEVKGVVYELSPRDSLRNLMVKVAQLLKFLHSQDTPYPVFNVIASHILLDWDLKPKLIDFQVVSKGIMDERSTQKKYMIRCVDPYFNLRESMCMTGGDWETSCEVFSFGIILLGLISKGIADLEEQENPDLILDHLLHSWAKMEYKPHCSLAHKTLQEDWGYLAEDGTAITELGMHCIEFFPVNRPSMEDVVERLESLHIFQRLGDSRPHKRDKKFHDDPMCM
ncbi:hypothetical protein FH972_011165 [Carpinus fangiana]|uniref:Protein kinase domain-containing protein n=1 Tax=Carpinus fangiana TaxID=176857 RepID=A0A660KSB3_9ROSI|nr:hypothetical protein FH972_011165 [Carpinus fangiana]